MDYARIQPSHNSCSDDLLKPKQPGGHLTELAMSENCSASAKATFLNSKATAICAQSLSDCGRTDLEALFVERFIVNP